MTSPASPSLSPAVASLPPQKTDDLSAFDPEVNALIAAVRAQGLPIADPTAMPVERARKLAERYHGFVNGRLPRISRAETLTLPGPAGDFPVRIVYPGASVKTGAAVPVIVWLHGGGFVLNSIDTHERLFRLLALRSGAAVVGIGYSKAPEQRFPIQAAEAAAALQWLRAHGAEKGLDPTRVALGGDSAGANLALSAAVAETAAGRKLSGLALFYGMYAPDFETESHKEHGDGRYGLSTERMRWYWSQYLGDADPRDPRAAPLHADLRGLPPTLLAAAGLDCLLDDSLCLAELLTEANVETDLSIYPSLPHSFALMTAWVRAADGAVTRAAARLSALLDVGPPL
jgi:acetyl esterase